MERWLILSSPRPPSKWAFKAVVIGAAVVTDYLPSSPDRKHMLYAIGAPPSKAGKCVRCARTVHNGLAPRTTVGGAQAKIHRDMCIFR